MSNISRDYDRRSMIKCSVLMGVVAASSPTAACASSRLVMAASYRSPGSSDEDVLRLAIAAWQRQGGGLLVLEPGHTYDLGRVNRGPDFFAISGLVAATIDGNGATIRAESDIAEPWNLLSFSNVQGLTIRDLAARDDGYRDAAWGMKAIVLQPGNSGAVDVHLVNTRVTRALTMLQAEGPVAGARVRRIRLDPDCRAEECYYGICFQDQGDELGGELNSVNCRRAYFVHGVEDHVFALRITHSGSTAVAASRSPVLVKSYGRTTRDLVLDVTFYGSLPWRGISDADKGSCVSLEHQSSEQIQSVISDIALTIDLARGIRDPYHPHALTLISYTPEGVEQSRTTGIWRNISLKVRSTEPRSIYAASNPQLPAIIRLSGCINLSLIQSSAPQIKFVT